MTRGWTYFAEACKEKNVEHYRRSKEELLREQSSMATGLSSEEAEKRIEQFGANELRQRSRTPLWKLFLDAWKDPMILILAIVVLVQMLLGEFLEAAVIFAVLVVNSLISVIQTRKAESSLEALREIAAPVAKVMRDGEIVTVPARELVPGDVVVLEAGDFVPADGRIVEVSSLKVDEGILTGESEPVLKTDEALKGELSLGDRINMVYSGTVAVHGRGAFLVTATGLSAEIGKIAALLEAAEERQTPLQRRLEHFSKRLGIWILALCALIFLVQTYRTVQSGEDLQAGILSALMFAIAVAVAAIPEALSSIVTIVLAVGTKKMANRSAIIRKLPAVEALGSTGVICTDKTGTLTQNKMTVREIWGADNLLLYGALCTDVRLTEHGIAGDPTETAIVKAALASGIDLSHARERYPRIGEAPFDSGRKRMSTLHRGPEGAMLIVKGAPDVLLDLCDLTEEERLEIRAKNSALASHALRVVAVAYKAGDDSTESGLTFLGLIAMIDPPREAVYGAIARAKRAQIKTVMITGDHKTTAWAIAREIGILEVGDVAVTGMELDAMTEEELEERLTHISVYARVSPENKIRIVKAWQKKGQITAMTGDGVNDAPSLKQADIGIAMGSGTEVAKDAAAMILTDDNFVSIVSAVEIGRTIFDNIKKAVGYLFSGNLGGIIVIVFALAVGWDKPLTPLQILFINLLNDSVPAIALGLEREEPNVMDRPPRNMNEGIFGGGLFRSVVIRGVLIGIAAILAQYLGMTLFSSAMGGAMAFTTLILARTLQTFSSRSNSQTVPQMGFFSNRYTMGAVGICFLLYGITLLPGARAVFYIPAEFGWHQWGIAAGLALWAVLGMELMKWVRNKFT